MRNQNALLVVAAGFLAITTLSACNSTGTSAGAGNGTVTSGATTGGATAVAADRFSPSFLRAHLRVRRTTVDDVLALYGAPAARSNEASPAGDRSVLTYIRGEAVPAGVGNALGAIASLTPVGSRAAGALYRAGGAVSDVETAAAAASASAATARGAGNKLELLFLNGRLVHWNLV
ncbi:hypothetical protein [Methylobacterium sp. JK268]